MEFPTKAKDFPFPGEVVELHATSTISEAMNTLLQRDILSLPIFDQRSRKYLGWFTISDLIPVFLSLDNTIKNLSDEELTADSVREISKRFSFKDSFIGSEATLEECFQQGVSPSFDWVPFTEEDALADIIQSLNTGRIKRVPVLNEEGKCVKIISQNAIMHFLHSKIVEMEQRQLPLPEIFHRSVKDLGLLKKVATVDHSTSVADCLSMMVETGHNAIGITDEGMMFLCITSRDLLKFRSLENIALNRFAIELNARDFEHGLEENEVEELIGRHLGRALEDMNCADFVSFVRQNSMRLHKARAAVVSVSPKNHLHKVMAKMSKTKCHRVFICEKKKPLGVVSVKDVVRIMFPPPS